jgi:hypothetical protein
MENQAFQFLAIKPKMNGAVEAANENVKKII